MVDSNEIMALCAIVTLLVWMWADVLSDWLVCWQLRRVTCELLCKLAIAGGVSAVIVTQLVVVGK